MDAIAQNPGPGTLTSRVADALLTEIRSGRFAAGDRLPGTRRLADELGVHRNTVNAALRDLAAQGIVDARPRSGHFVSDEWGRWDAEEGLHRTARSPGGARSCGDDAGGRELGVHLGRDAPGDVGHPPLSAEFLLTGGLPDPRLFPGELLARAYRRALRRGSDTLLDYGDARGLPRLRDAMREDLLERRGLVFEDEELAITRGSQMALALVARALIRPGDRVGVEALGYPPAWAAFREAGAVLVPLRVDDDGLCLDSLDAALSEGPLRSVYITPHHQYPTMAVLSETRRARLLELARRHEFVILEDDYDAEYHFEGRPILPLAARDDGGQVVHVGTLSKVLSPGLRIGYLVAAPALVRRVAELRTYLDRQGDSVGEAAVAELIEDGELARHVRRTRRLYAARRDALVEALGDRLGGALSIERAAGGMALWTRVEGGVDAEAWAMAARARGVVVTHGAHLAFDHAPIPNLRIGFARHDEDEIREAVSRLAAAHP